MGEIDHPSILDAQVDHDRRTAEPGMSLGGRVGMGEPPKPGNIRRQLENAPIVDVVDHPGPIFGFAYIGGWTAEIEAFGKARGRLRADERCR